MERFKYSTRKALCATAILAAWFAGIRYAWPLLTVTGLWEIPASMFLNFVLVTLPPFAFGVFVGRPRFAFACGAISAIFLGLWQHMPDWVMDAP